MFMFKKLWRKIGPNPLDLRLKRMQKPGARVLFTWNRGLGDIPLGLYALVLRIREFIPDAEVTVLTRRDLQEGFELLQDVKALVGSTWKRGVPVELDKTLAEHNLSRASFDLILENPDPTHWAKWQLGKLTPRLTWNSVWDARHEAFPCEGRCVGVHVQTETTYGYEKNWPLSSWRELFSRLTQELGCTVLLFGFQPTEDFIMERVIDLRGKTNLYEMLSLIKNRCSYLVVPDSGVLSITYYIDAQFPIRIVSLWADPRQGVLKQNVSSPNRELKHIPLLGKDENVANISVNQVIDALLC